ncbi:hypothetical protein T4D_402 [Trichinella pseudospiralis]|uniref:Uncharacterized protein n=1 Tax=Trichinella pseudospiralis TaxID=6337 RepID=A0A0V1FZT7_TRIPS|nr:hypothetical protein T4D_402 [Trichinella pseudospiralis]
MNLPARNACCNNQGLLLLVKFHEFRFALWPSNSVICALPKLFRKLIQSALNIECRISANTWRFYSYTLLISYNPTQLPESCMRYHETSTDLHANYLSIYIYFYSFD